MIPFADEVCLEITSFAGTGGRRLFGLRSAPRDRSRHGLVLLPPGYERRPHHYSVLSRYLVRHGYETLRFDLANHVGLSDGDICNFTMSSMANDIASVASACVASERGPRTVVASSLAARALVRSLADKPSLQNGIDGVVLILPVIDTEYTTTQAVGRNVIDDWRSGRVTDPTQPCQVLGHTVCFQFSHDALEHGFDGVERTQRELASLGCPVTAIAAERDDWVNFEDVEAAMAVDASARRETVILAATSHDLSTNAPVMRALMEEVVSALTADTGQEPSPVQHLEFDEIVETVTYERHLKTGAYGDLALAKAAS